MKNQPSIHATAAIYSFVTAVQNGWSLRSAFGSGLTSGLYDIDAYTDLVAMWLAGEMSVEVNGEKVFAENLIHPQALAFIYTLIAQGHSDLIFDSIATMAEEIDVNEVMFLALFPEEEFGLEYVGDLNDFAIFWDRFCGAGVVYKIEKVSEKGTVLAEYSELSDMEPKKWQYTRGIKALGSLRGEEVRFYINGNQQFGNF